MSDVQIILPAPHSGQMRVIREAKRFNVLECGRRFGKTTLGQRLLIKSAIKGAPVAWFAPTYKLLAEVWRSFITLLQPAASLINQQEKHIELLTGGSLDCWSLDEVNAGRGRKYQRVVIDEAGIVRSLEAAWQEAIRPTLADLKGDAWFLGTPKGRGSFFHRLFAKGESDDPLWRSWRLPTISNPAIDAAEIECARRDLPESAFNQEFLGIPSDDGGNPFGLAAIRDCIRPLSNNPPRCYGVDLAKSVDWTVVCGLDEDAQVCRLERWQSDWGQTRRRIAEEIGDAPALIDSTGVGDPIVEDIRRTCAGAVGYKFTPASKQQLMEGLASSIQKRDIGFPEGWLSSELENFEYEYRQGGVRYSAPDGLHDDGVCALSLADELRRQLRRSSFTISGSPVVIVG